jgi:surface polysaccharide O-acyltransferase-like enzyme
MRNNIIDVTRLVAAFLVITLHVGYYQDVSNTFGELIRISGRWAVPFFFLISGYFIGLNKKERKCYLQAFRIIKILFISSLIFLPYCLLKNPNYLETISIVQLLKRGTYFHLWFLSSLAIGLLSFQILHMLMPRWLISISIALIIVFIITDINANLKPDSFFSTIFGVSRHTISLAFIIIGHKLSNLDLNNFSLSIKEKTLFLVLCTLYFIEPFITEIVLGADPMLRQFPVFTAFITIGVMFICLKIRLSANMTLSEAGRLFSLGIYLLHPIFLPTFHKIFNYLSVPPTIPTLMMTFLTSWLAMYFLMKRMPVLYNILSGNFSLKRLYQS